MAPAPCADSSTWLGDVPGFQPSAVNCRSFPLNLDAGTDGVGVGTCESEELGTGERERARAVTWTAWSAGIPQ